MPGASPDEMATSVVEPIEEALSSISGIDELTSGRITEGFAYLTVKFVLERDINDAANDVREKVASAMGRVPPELLTPVITKVDPDSDPVMTILVSSDAMSLRTLTEIADKQVKRAIQTVNGVGQVEIGGGRAREVHIVVDIEKLNSYGLSIQQVRDAVVARTSRSRAVPSSKGSRSCCSERSAESMRRTSSTTSSSRPTTERRSACRTSAMRKTASNAPRARPG